MARKAIYIGTDNLVTVDGLKDEDGAFVNDATVEARVLDGAGNEVSGQTWPVTLSYVSGSDGQYEGVIDDAVSLDEGTGYLVEVTAEKNGTKVTWRELREAKYKVFS